MGTNWKQMLPMMAAMMVVGLTVQLIMTGKIGALLQVFVILGVIALAVFLLYAIEVLPKPMMIWMDRITGRTDRLKTSRRSKIEQLTRDRVQLDVARNRAKELVHGQDDIVDGLFDALAVKLANRSRQGVLLSALIGGPKATGKGRVAAVSALTIYGDPRDTVTLDLSKFDPDEIAAQLFTDQGALWNTLARDNEVVVVIDHADQLLTRLTPQLRHALTDLLENARIAGKPIAVNTTLLMLTDIGHAEMADLPASVSSEDVRRKMAGLLDQRLPGTNAAGLFDLVTSTRPLEAMDKARIIIRHLTDIASGFEVEVESVDPTVLANMVALWNELSGVGSEEILRTIKRKCNVAFAKAAQRGQKSVVISWDDATEEINCI